MRKRFFRFFNVFLVAISLIAFIGLSAELAFTEVSVDRKALVGTILTLQAIAILMIVVARILRPKLYPQSGQVPRTRKRRIVMPLS